MTYETFEALSIAVLVCGFAFVAGAILLIEAVERIVRIIDWFRD